MVSLDCLVRRESPVYLVCPENQEAQVRNVDDGLVCDDWPFLLSEGKNLKQNEAQSARAESSHKGVD